MSVVVMDGGDGPVVGGGYICGGGAWNSLPSTDEDWDEGLPFDLRVSGKRWTAKESGVEEQATKCNCCSEAERPGNDDVTEHSESISTTTTTMNRKRASSSNDGVLDALQLNEGPWQSKKRRQALSVDAVNVSSMAEDRTFKEERTARRAKDLSTDRQLMSNYDPCPQSGSMHEKEATYKDGASSISHREPSTVVDSVGVIQCESSQMTVEAGNPQKTERNPSGDRRHQLTRRSDGDKSPFDHPIELSRYDVIYLKRNANRRSDDATRRSAYHRNSSSDQPTALLSSAANRLLTPDVGCPVDLRKRPVEDFVQSTSSIVDLSAASTCCVNACCVEGPSPSKAESLSRPKKPTRRVQNHQTVLRASSNCVDDELRIKKLRCSPDDRCQVTAEEEEEEEMNESSRRRFHSSDSSSGSFNGFPRCSSTEIHRYTPNCPATSNQKRPKSDHHASSDKSASGSSDISLRQHLSQTDAGGAVKRVNPTSPVRVETYLGSRVPKRARYLPAAAGEDMNTHRKGRCHDDKRVSGRFAQLLDHPEVNSVSEETLERSWKVRQIMTNYYAALRRRLFPLGGARFAAPHSVIPFSPSPALYQRAPVSLTVYPYQQHVETPMDRSFEHMLRHQHQRHLVPGHGSSFYPPPNHRWYYETKMTNHRTNGPYYVIRNQSGEPFDSQIYGYPTTKYVAENGQYVFPGMMDICNRLPRSTLSDHVPPLVYGPRGQQLKNNTCGYRLLTSAATESHPFLSQHYPKEGQGDNVFSNGVMNPHQTFVHAEPPASNSRYSLPNTGNCTRKESTAAPTAGNKAASVFRGFRKDTRTLQSVLDGIMKLRVIEEGTSKENNANDVMATVKEETIARSAESARPVLEESSRSIGGSTTLRNVLDILVEDAVKNFQDDSTVAILSQIMLEDDAKEQQSDHKQTALNPETAGRVSNPH